MKEKFRQLFLNSIKCDTVNSVESCTVPELYSACAKAVNGICSELKKQNPKPKKRAAYFSAEFLTGKFLESDLYNLGLTDAVDEILKGFSRRLSDFETIDDPALGNGGLGRLAACYLDSAACMNIPLDGYGIRYKYGLFRQQIKNGKQVEHCDNWQRFTDSFGIRNESEKVTVKFSDISLFAVPYDYYIPGTDGKTINRLRLYEAETKSEPFDFSAFNAEKPFEAYKNSCDANAVCALLYPDDSTDEGKKLRIKQQYFLCSAALQNIITEITNSGKNLKEINSYTVIQLNDTHPAVAIPEFIRILCEKGLSFDDAFELAGKVFAYTNHTVMGEALEKWDAELYKKILPEIYEIINHINNKLVEAFKNSGTNTEGMKIIENGFIHMARLCVFCCFSVNGVANIHTNILKNDLMKQWHYISPKKFSNKTNGITQRRWLAVSNPALTSYLNTLTGENCIENISALNSLKRFSADSAVFRKLCSLRYENKKRLSEYVFLKEGKQVDADSIFFVQVKRIHEYKRQLMNALSIADIYFMMKSGLMKDVPPVTFFIGGKAAASYKSAKLIIQYINALAELINSDSEISKKLKLVFLENYDVSYAQKIIPAADFSEQISLVTTEASGTGNMKFMMNGAVTIGTFDGANVEIAQYAGKENCIIFGMAQDEYEKEKLSYEPEKLYNSDARIKRAVDTLKNPQINPDGELNALYDSLLKEDRYMILKDLTDYTNARLKAMEIYSDKNRYWSMSLMNTASSAYFSSDRAVREYAEGIWFNDEAIN
ncbi:MAG: glycogen/starch/alpha-glucan family phosphorylase [Clostridia bacterium]|nr:glycogen/starch/alpha-glucan family phosphorylase [Clostridia bacterium]